MQGLNRFSELEFFRHLSASCVLPVFDLGLTLRACKAMILTYTEKSTITDEVLRITKIGYEYF